MPPLPPASEFTGPQGRYTTILRIIEAEKPTVRQLLGRLAAGGGHCTMVGTPEQIADQIELWFSSGAADGFNLYITRTIKDGSGVHTDVTKTIYKPWRAVYEIGPRG